MSNESFGLVSGCAIFLHRRWTHFNAELSTCELFRTASPLVEVYEVSEYAARVESHVASRLFPECVIDVKAANSETYLDRRRFLSTSVSVSELTQIRSACERCCLSYGAFAFAVHATGARAAEMIDDHQRVDG